VPGDPLTVVADRMAIADLVHRYAQGVDGRDPDAVAQLFTDDGTFIAYATPGAAEPTSRRRGRGEIATAIGSVRRFRATTHIIASHVATVDGDQAVGETRCVAYHVVPGQEGETLLIWHHRYLDRYVRSAEGWRIVERVLRVDLVSERPLDIS